MVYQTLDAYNATNLSAVMAYTTAINPGFWPMVLFAVFIIGTLGSYYSQKRLSGTGDFFGSAAVSSYLVTVMALFLSFIPGVLDLYVLIITLGVTMGITILFLLSREKL